MTPRPRGGGQDPDLDLVGAGGPLGLDLGLVARIAGQIETGIGAGAGVIAAGKGVASESGLKHLFNIMLCLNLFKLSKHDGIQSHT